MARRGGARRVRVQSGQSQRVAVREVRWDGGMVIGVRLLLVVVGRYTAAVAAMLIHHASSSSSQAITIIVVAAPALLCAQVACGVVLRVSQGPSCCAGVVLLDTTLLLVVSALLLGCSRVAPPPPPCRQPMLKRVGAQREGSGKQGEGARTSAAVPSLTAAPASASWNSPAALSPRRTSASPPPSAAAPSPFLPTEVSPAVVREVNFRRLLARVELRVKEEREVGLRGGKAEIREELKEKESPVSRRTSLIKALQRLRAQLEALQPQLDQTQLSGLASRVSRLWSEEARLAPLPPPHSTRSSAGSAPSLAASTAASHPRRAAWRSAPAVDLSPPSCSSSPIPRPPLPILSSSSLDPLPPPPAPSSPPPSAHPIADASLFTAQHVRPSAVNPSLIKARLFAHQQPHGGAAASPPSSSPSPSSLPSASSPSAASASGLSREHEAGLTALSLLAPALKEQVRAIAAHLQVDEEVVADTSSMMAHNVQRISTENSRLKQWARASCSETCWMTATIALLLAAFAVMVALMKLVPKPRT